MGRSTPERKLRTRLATATGATALAMIGTSPADAALLIDVRATGVSFGLLDNGKSVFAFPGSTVTLGVFAQVSGTDGVNNETFNSAYGLLNSVGLAKGNLSGGVAPGFNDSSHQNGSVTDWDSDGDLDIGVSPTSSSSTGKFFARNATAGGLPLTPINANTGEVLIGQFVFTVTAAGESTVINFLRRNNNGGNVSVAALWFEDGSTIAKQPSNSSFSVNPIGVTIIAPEPSSLGLMALGSVGILRQRRQRNADQHPTHGGQSKQQVR
jgi:hypothetical protein